MPAETMAGALVDIAVGLLETVVVAKALVDAVVNGARVGTGEVAGGLERFDGLPCCAEASTGERIATATGRMLEKDRRNMMPINVAENFKDARP
jgi:hypothetical protein